MPGPMLGIYMYFISFDLHKNPMRYKYYHYPCFRDEGTKNTEMKFLPKVTKLISSRAKTGTQGDVQVFLA